MFKKILIANRGEIAVRIIRACREMNIETVAVYSEADRESLHVELADEAICIGPGDVRKSYLNVNNILSATILTGAEAIHPGFGFLSENSKFARICEECNIKFIGPSHEVIDTMGNKSNAIALMKKHNVPVVPGSEGSLSCFDECKVVAKEIGYPVMIKAAHGGGGRGIRIVWEPSELEKEYLNAKAEAEAAFGNGELYLEKYVVEPRHIEIQILADKKGNAVHLGERDCSIQRRNQKVIEEAPSPSLSKTLRKKMGDAAVNAAKAVGYENAGTVEFLVDKYDNFYFIEMNTRIQVEHGITEMITGVDIVKEQLKIAAGHTLSFKQKDVEIKGHAIECRINAEDPDNDFRPSPGKIEKLFLPSGLGVRVDSGVYDGYTISPFYDSMIGKLITYGKDRDEAIARMRRSLGEFIIQGVENNVDFQLRLINEKEFLEGKYHTGFINSL